MRMTTIEIIKNNTYAVTQFTDEYGTGHKLYQEIQNGTIEAIPHRLAKVWNDINDLYFEFLDNQLF